MSSPSPAPVVAIPSATVVPLRDGPDGLEVLMIQRAEAIAYGGMWAFPGGRVEASDADPDAHDDAVRQALRAAVREAEEEVGLRIPPSALLPYSHWTGGSGQGRLYAAWYFLALAPAGDVVLDEAECRSHRWVRPGDAVAARDRGEIAVVAPTWMTLHSLAGARTVEDALALAHARPPVIYRSRVADHDGGRVVLWHGDAGYDEGDPAMTGPRHRLVMASAGWSFEQTV